jgi:hypothetical protein
MKAQEEFKNSKYFKEAHDKLFTNQFMSDEQKQRLSLFIDSSEVYNSIYAQAFENRLIVEQQLNILSKMASGETLSNNEEQAFKFGIASTFDRNGVITTKQNHGITHTSLIPELKDEKFIVVKGQIPGKDPKFVLDRGTALADSILHGTQIKPNTPENDVIDIINKKKSGVDGNKPSS